MIATCEKTLRFKRTRGEETDVSIRKINESACGRYRVSLSVCKYGPPPKIKRGGKFVTNPAAMPDVVRAEVLIGNRWEIISRHKKRIRAKAACQRHFRRHTEMES